MSTHIGTHIPAHTPKPKLTAKQAAYVQARVHEGKSATDAYIQAYEHKGTRKTAHEEGSRTARKPQVSLALAKYSSEAEDTVLTVMRYASKHGNSGTTAGAAYASVAVGAAKDVLDRVHGKATQRVETSSKAVIISVDLTGVTQAQTDTEI